MVILVNYEPICPGFESRESHDFFFFFFLDFIYLFFFFYVFCHYYYSANLQIQHYRLYSVSPTVLLLMMPRPPAPSALCSIFSGAGKFFLAYRIRKSVCFTWTDNSDLTHVISPRTG